MNKNYINQTNFENRRVYAKNVIPRTAIGLGVGLGVNYLSRKVSKKVREIGDTVKKIGDKSKGLDEKLSKTKNNVANKLGSKVEKTLNWALQKTGRETRIDIPEFDKKIESPLTTLVAKEAYALQNKTYDYADRIDIVGIYGVIIPAIIGTAFGIKAAYSKVRNSRTTKILADEIDFLRNNYGELSQRIKSLESKAEN